MKNVANTCIVLTALVVFLYFGKALIIPFVLALFIYFIINALQAKILKLKPIEKYVSKGLVSIITAITIVGIIVLFGKMLSANINRMIANLDAYEGNLVALRSVLPDVAWQYINDNQDSLLNNIQFSSLVQNIANALSTLIGNTALIVIYLIFILLEQYTFEKKMDKIAGLREDPKKFKQLLANLNETISGYINLKIIVSAITGVGSYVVFAIVGLDAPIFWSTIVFVLNFIPTIGSIVGTIFPTVFALLQFGAGAEVLQILIPLAVIQIAVGNFLEPKLMGDSLNISALVVLLSLSVWGAIWGITGMLLSVPLTVIAIKIMAQFPSTRAAAILLGNGK